MLGVNQLDFINYANALKGNYRKGVHKMEAIMASPTHAKEFASNLGGVSVVLSVPIGKEDRNSAQLLDLLLNSDVADDAVYTWLGQFYEFSSWDDLLGDESRCNEIMNDPLKSRAVSGSGVAVGKMVATIAGLSCSAYADMSAVAASSTAMTAVAASSTAMAAIFRSDAALQAIAKNATAQAAVSNASSSVMAKTVAILANLDPNSYADMTAIASSSTAMTAVAGNATAIRAVAASAVAKTAMIANNDTLQSVANTWWNTMQSGFNLVRAQRDDDGVTSANSVNAKYIMFAIPGGYNSGSGSTNCFHGHNGAAAGSASGSYTATAKRKILLGGGTFTESEDGMVRTWVYSI